MLPPVVERLKKDCTTHGYGRKTWWARQLGVPPLTLSHWLAGRQKPNGRNSLKISEAFKHVQEESHKKAWKEYLWDAYYTGQPIPEKILPLIILEILSRSSLDSRTAALLSHFIERAHPDIPTPDTPELRNRLGWLLEMTGLKPTFAPDRSAGLQTLLKLFPRSRQLKKYLRRYQTRWGRKWYLYDCPLETLKASLL